MKKGHRDLQRIEPLRARLRSRSADQRLQLTWRDLGTVEVTLDDLDAERREGRFLLDRLDGVGDDARADLFRLRDQRADPEIGRASCRERV